MPPTSANVLSSPGGWTRNVPAPGTPGAACCVTTGELTIGWAATGWVTRGWATRGWATVYAGREAAPSAARRCRSRRTAPPSPPQTSATSMISSTNRLRPSVGPLAHTVNMRNQDSQHQKITFW
jgi:hypothetical protein